MHPHNQWFVRQFPGQKGWASKETLIDHVLREHHEINIRQTVAAMEKSHYMAHSKAHWDAMSEEYTQELVAQRRPLHVENATPVILERRGKKVRCFFDTEFYDNGRTIDLLSIGVVTELGSTFYAENADANLDSVGDWVRENVIGNLEGGSVLLSKTAIASNLKDFISSIGGHPEFWAYYGDYDWVVLCQLYGGMTELPRSWPKFAMDLKQKAVLLGNPRLIGQTTPEHHALNDAIWTKHAYEALERSNLA